LKKVGVADLAKRRPRPLPSHAVPLRGNLYLTRRAVARRRFAISGSAGVATTFLTSAALLQQSHKQALES
jgi:hypothetical protein